MATVYKRTRLKQIPDGAEITKRGQGQFAVWTDVATGKKRRAPLNEAGTRIVIEAEFYTIEYFDHEGKRRRKGTRYADKDTAQQLANDFERRAADRREGRIDATQERITAQGKRPLMDHLTEFKAALVAKGNTSAHCNETYLQAQRVVERCNAQHIRDLTASSVQAAIKSIRDAGRSLKTCNHYSRAIKMFSRWLYRDKRAPDDALATLEGFNVATDARRVRREMLLDELTWLVTVTEGRTLPEHNMSGPDRAMAYRLALGTGFRKSELQSLTPASFDLDAETPTVTVEAAHSKRRRKDEQPIRRDLAESLRGWLKGRPTGERLFAKLPHNAARMLRSDLKAARDAWLKEAGDDDRERERRQKVDFLKYENDAGAIFDFHATRHTYISSIVNGGASVKVAQELARHSTPTLTIGRYAHTRLHDLESALDALPDLTRATALTTLPEPMRATGTDDVHPDEGWAQNGQQLSGCTEQILASSGESDDDAGYGVHQPRTVEFPVNGKRRRVVATAGAKYPLGESNPCCRTENPES